MSVAPLPKSKPRKSVAGKSWPSCSMDGIVARRTPALPEADARTLTRLFSANPAFAAAWMEPLPNSSRFCVRWLPASAEGQARVELAFLDGEIAKATGEGQHYIFVPLGDFVRCTNPRSKTKGGVSRWMISLSRRACDCPRFKAAGVCKHILRAAMLGLLDAREEEPEPAPTSEAPGHWTYPTLAAPVAPIAIQPAKPVGFASVEAFEKARALDFD